MLMAEAARLDRYKDSLRAAWGYNDYNDWPIKLNSIMHLFLKEFTSEFLEDLEKIKAEGISIAEAGKAFGNPARVYRLINPLLFGMKRLRMEIAKQREVAVYLLDVVKSMKYGSEFNEDCRNIILSPGEVTALCRKFPFRTANEQEAALLQRFCGIMWAYTEAIFFRAHDVTKEMHGPYYTDDTGEMLLVRSFLNLAPDDIGIQFPFIPFSAITIYARYRQTLDICIDSYNHLTSRAGNYVQDLVNYRIEADGNDISIDALIKIVPVLQSTIKNVHDWVSKADARALINRYADIFWYRKKPLSRLAGRQGIVPDEVRENIRNGEAETRRQELLSEEAIDRLISFII